MIPPHTVCLQTLYEETYQQAMDCFFDGDEARGEFLFKQAKQYYERIEQGELYEPLF